MPQQQDANPYPSRDSAQEILDAAGGVSNRVRATAWDVYHQSADEESFRKGLDSLPLPNDTKAALWDAKFGAHPKTVGEHVGESAKTFLQTINPVPAIDALGRALIPEFIGNAIGLNADPSKVPTGPINAFQADATARGQVAQKPGIGHQFYSMIPFLGPSLSEAASELERGDVGAGIGRSIGVGAATFGPSAVANARLRVPPVARNTNPVEAAAVQFGEQRGIPIDAATATGRPVVRSLQKRASESIGGAGIADDFKQQQSAAFTSVGDELAERANATRTGRGGPPQDRISAGEAVQGRLESRINAQARVADRAYEQLRAMEQQQAQRIAQTGGHQAPPNAAKPFTDVPLAVDVASTKTALQPLYQGLLRESQLTTLQGGKARTLVALDRLMNGPDLAPLSVVDAALGDLKAMSRTADLPALRTQGQATAAEAVRHLEAEVMAAARRGGPQVVDALQRGRQATIGKYETAGVREQLSGEPAQVFQQLTAGKDVGLDRLRAVAQHAPREVPKIARAYLEELMHKATAEGGFGHADALWAEWQRIGPETKAILFRGDRGLIADINNFFLLAKQAARNPNPSGTAQVMSVLNVGTAPVTYTLAKLLYSRQGVRALTQGLTAAVGRRGQATAATGSLGELARLAREAADLEALPAAAEDETQTPPARATPVGPRAGRR